MLYSDEVLAVGVARAKCAMSHECFLNLGVDLVHVVGLPNVRGVFLRKANQNEILVVRADL